MLGTEYWDTQSGGANNHQTLMVPNRQERNYTFSPTTEGWLRLARPLRADSASPDDWEQALPRSTSEGWLCLARCLRADSASPDV